MAFRVLQSVEGLTFGCGDFFFLNFSVLSDRCERVLSLVRTPFDFTDEARKAKLTQQIVDFDQLKSFAVPAGFTVAFSCIGMREPSK